MSEIKLIDKDLLTKWLQEKQKPEYIEAILKEKGIDQDSIEVTLKDYQRMINAKRQFTAFICMGTGAFIGFISCLLAILNPMPELHNFFLYGLTTVAVIIVFIGLYLLFE